MNAIKHQSKTPKKGLRKNNHRTKVTTKQENTCIMHNHQLKYMNHLTNKTTTYKELMPTKNHKTLNRRDQSTKRLTSHTPIPKEAGEEEKQHKGGRMEANHREIRAQV